MNLSFLRGLYEYPGPWASVYLDASHDTEDAEKARELRWRAAREKLDQAGCDAATLDALERAILDHRDGPGGYGLAVFASGGEVRRLEVLDAPPRAPIATYAPLPHAMPMVAQLGERIPYVRVLVNRVGGDIESVDTGHLTHSSSVEGSERYPIRRVKPGGWSQPRYQRAAQESWHRNTGTVAEAVSVAADATGAEVIVVAGDPQSRPLLIAQLPEYWRERVVETDAGARAAGADLAALDDVTIQAVAERAEEHERDILDRYHSQRGRDAAASDGLPAVVSALQRGQVDTVLLVDDPSSTDHLWVGPEPTQVSFDRAELKAMGVTEPWPVRADAALVRTLAGTDGGLMLVGPDELGVDGGVAALLRYADAGTRHR